MRKQQRKVTHLGNTYLLIVITHLTINSKIKIQSINLNKDILCLVYYSNISDEVEDVSLSL